MMQKIFDRLDKNDIIVISNTNIESMNKLVGAFIAFDNTFNGKSWSTDEDRHDTSRVKYILFNLKNGRLQMLKHSGDDNSLDGYIEKNNYERINMSLEYIYPTVKGTKKKLNL